MAPMLELDDVWRVYGDGDTQVVGLRAAELRVEVGELVAVVGPSGSGKSTLLQVLGLLDTPTSGHMRLGGVSVETLSDAERTRMRLRTIGFVFQRFHLLPGLSALENVALPLEEAGMPSDACYAHSALLLSQVGLAERINFVPEQLSGGQRQRVAVARALANDAPLILADEPTGALHTDDKQVIIDLLKEAHRRGHTLVVVTHDPDIARETDRRIEIRDGRLRPMP